MKTTITPKQNCPNCDYKMDRASPAFEEEAVPQEGDLSICIKCGQLLVFNTDLTFRALSAEAYASIPDDVKQQIEKLTKAHAQLRTDKP